MAKATKSDERLNPIARTVLVATFRPENAEWIKSRRLYNLPLPKCGKVVFHDRISRIVLIAEGWPTVAYSAKLKDVVDHGWLKAEGYKAAPRDAAHGEKYALYELGEKLSAASVLSDVSADVFVSSSRCPNVRIDAAFYAMPYPKTGGKSMPYVFDKLKPYFKKWHTATTFNPIQEDFVESAFEFGDKALVAQGLIEKARASGELTCVEICAGAGGQALGLDRAGFRHVALVEYEREYCDVQHLRPGDWEICNLGSKNAVKTASFSQYEHLAILTRVIRENQELATIVGNDYMAAPDIVVSRNLCDDKEINATCMFVDNTIALKADLRKLNGGNPIMHASVSAKWTMRSDSAQSSRTEALNLIRNRKGHLPHVVVVTGEPLPSRLASLALGTGDLDCVYHFALYELVKAVREYGKDDRQDLVDQLEMLIEGKRLKDISDLPLDLAC